MINIPGNFYGTGTKEEKLWAAENDDKYLRRGCIKYGLRLNLLLLG
jgi:hypothetical protein